MKRALILIVVIALAVGGGLLWLRSHPSTAPALAAKLGLTAREPGAPLTLYGNVEIRQVDLAFGVEGLIADMMAEGGDHIAAGQTLARLDPSSFTYDLESAEANLNSARSKLAVLLAGNRQQDIDRSRALVAEAVANLKIAELTLERNAELLKRAVNSQAQFDSALAGRDAAQATLDQRRADLSLMIAARARRISTRRAPAWRRRKRMWR
jgi:HlyD family secretion protein